MNSENDIFTQEIATKIFEQFMKTNVEFEGKMIPYFMFLDILSKKREKFILTYNEYGNSLNEDVKSILKDVHSPMFLANLSFILENHRKKINDLFSCPYNNGFLKIEVNKEGIKVSNVEDSYSMMKTVFVNLIDEIYLKFMETSSLVKGIG